MTTSASTEDLTLIIISSGLLKSYMTHCVWCNSGFRKDRHDFFRLKTIEIFVIFVIVIIIIFFFTLLLSCIYQFVWNMFN